MTNVINLNITPITALQVETGPYTLSSGASRPPLAPPPNKRLRSCLSPARSRPTTPFDERPDEPLSGYTSRSTSYGSGSERSKSVRWEGEVPVTSYFDTWSRDEYDRTPLDAPSAEERACVLPERNSRCMTRTYQCFLSDDEHPVLRHSRTPSPLYESPLSSPALAALDEALTAIHELPGEGLDEEDEWDAENDDEHADADAADDDDDAEEEEEEWDECMRRRMMFLQHCRQDADRQPQFDGYRSISATLADVLRSVGCDQPDVAPQQEEGASAMRMEATMSAENLALVDHRIPPATPSLTSASTSEESETETLVNADQVALVAAIDSTPASPVLKAAAAVATAAAGALDLTPVTSARALSTTPTPL